MLHMLIVEDVRDTLELICEYLEDAYPGAQLHPAESVRDAFKCINEIKERGERFKITVLDFALPQTPGDQPDVETELPRAVQRAMTWDGAVFHITAYPEDPRIVRYMQEQLRNPRSARLYLISKLEDNWTKTLYETIHTILAGNRIEEQMDRLFPSRNQGQGDSSRGRYGPSLVTDPTHDLAALCRDAADNWKGLDSDLQDRIRGVLHVDESDPQQVTVGTLGDSLDELVGIPRDQ
jgi:CheY-like chemotaxis protein